MPTARAALTAGVIGGRLYAAGGAANGEALRTLEVYDFRTGRWSPGPPMRVAREHLGGAVSGNAFYVLAGRAAGAGNFTVAERYVPVAPPLGAAAGHDASPAAAPRRRRSSDGRIVIAGGEEAAGTIREVELYDPRRRTLEPAARHADAAPRARGRRQRPRRLHDRGRPAAGLSLLERDRALRVRLGREVAVRRRRAAGG